MGPIVPGKRPGAVQGPRGPPGRDPAVEIGGGIGARALCRRSSSISQRYRLGNRECFVLIETYHRDLLESYLDETGNPRRAAIAFGVGVSFQLVWPHDSTTHPWLSTLCPPLASSACRRDRTTSEWIGKGAKILVATCSCDGSSDRSGRVSCAPLWHAKLLFLMQLHQRPTREIRMGLCPLGHHYGHHYG